MPKSIQRVLIYRLGSLGDHVVALPCLHLIARTYPNAERRMLTNVPVSSIAPAAAAVLEGTGLLHGYIRYVVGLRNPLHILRLWFELRLWGPDVLIYLTAARGVAVAERDRRFFRLCGVKHQIGVPDTDDLQQNRLMPDGRTWEAECARLARNLAELGDARLASPESWSLALSEAEQQRAAQVLEPLTGKRIVAMSLGTKRQCNDWGVENWIALARHLASKLPEHALILTGAPVERAMTERVAEAWKASGSRQALNLCGELSPRESAAALAGASVFIGHDSGPMHLAAAMQTPCVAIFAARQRPGVWFPYGTRHKVIYHQVDCWGCGLDTCVLEKKRCITSISVDEVAEQVRRVLAEGYEGRV